MPDQTMNHHYTEIIEKLLTTKPIYPPVSSEIDCSIAAMEKSEQIEVALVLLHWCQTNIDDQNLDYSRWQVSDAFFRILQRQLPFTLEQVLAILTALQGDDFFLMIGMNRLPALIRYYLKENRLTSSLQIEVEKICQRLEVKGSSERKCASKLRKLFPSNQLKNPILLGEAWADVAIAFLETLPTPEHQIWIELLAHCAETSSSKPSLKWLKMTRKLREEIGIEKFQITLLTWFALVDSPRTRPLTDGRSYLGLDLITDQNADILRGLVWLCADFQGEEIAKSLGKLAISAYRKLPQFGPRCLKLGNACLWTLGQMLTPEAIAQLSLLKVKIKGATAQKGIEKAFDEAAQRTGISQAEIEEISVPTYGLTSVGLRQEVLGNFTAILTVTGNNTVNLSWLKADRTPQKSIPQAVKTDYPDAIKALKQAQKDLQKMLPAQSDRLESLYLQQKTWDFSIWQERYLDHPLMGCLVRKLLWQFEGEGHHAIGIWHDGGLRNLAGELIFWLQTDSKVSLWHPIMASPDTIQAWRHWLLEKEIQQPFKQAHREIYLLTPAEENTRLYSNRFAAHILKQHQFNALCAQRGWKNKLRLMVDDECPPATLRLTHWNLRAEFWIEAIGEDYGTDTNDTGTFLYLATDQVRFYDLNASENSAHACGGGYGTYGTDPARPMALSDIPALVFTEIMRDVDLFVGVASVGNDPNWFDGGPDGRHLTYWQNYSFGELSATAQTRRQVLETLIPRLKKIGDRCAFQDRFLVVRGDIRTYKIHLGSGNILMEPNDQYLCIVKASEHRGDSGQIFLPFAGDKTLAVILSKAFLLAEDRKITDPTILSQINR